MSRATIEQFKAAAKEQAEDQAAKMLPASLQNSALDEATRLSLAHGYEVGFMEAYIWLTENHKVAGFKR